MSDFKSFSKKLKKAVKKIYKDLSNDKLIEDANKESVKEIKKRTRAGFGVTRHGGSKNKLDKLSPEYKKQRRTMNLSSQTSPNKSNLTQTGDMIDSIQAQGSKIVLSGDANIDKAKWVSTKRPFMYLSKQELKRLINRLEDNINNLFKKYL